MDQQQITKLEEILKVALVTGDKREEAIARVNLAATLVHVDKERAFVDFDEALSAVRRAEYLRGEAILGLNFAIEFLEKGDVKRARRIGERAVELSQAAIPIHRILSNLNLARIYCEGLDLADEALNCLREAHAVLAELADDDDNAATKLIDELSIPIAMAGKTAITCGDSDLAVDFLRLSDPAAAAALDEQRDELTRPPDVAELNDSVDARLDEPLQIWRDYRAKGRLAYQDELPELIADFASSAADLYLWDDENARDAAPSIVLPSKPASSNGPAGWLRVAERLGRGELAMATAEAAVEELSISDDDIVFLVTFCGKHRERSNGSTAFVAMELAGRTVEADGLGGKLLRLVAAISKDNTQVKELLELADERLAGGANDPLRAEVWNELAVNQLNQGEMKAAAKYASEAYELAINSGAEDIAIMARGNLANVLMQSGHLKEAIEILEEMAVEQDHRGDARGLEITRFNIEACRNALDRKDV